MGANTMSEALRQSQNGPIIQRFVNAPTAAFIVFLPDKKYRLRKATMCAVTASIVADSQLDVRVVRAGDTTASGADVGDRMVASPFDGDGTAEVIQEREPASDQGQIVHKGDRVIFVPLNSGGSVTTLTALAGGMVQLEFEPLE